MPNEKIRHIETGTFLSEGNPEARYERTTVATIHWYPDQNVILEVDSSGEQIGFVDPEGKIIGEPFSSLAIPLSRYEINRIIKTLRRARDAAYGRDE